VGTGGKITNMYEPEEDGPSYTDYYCLRATDLDELNEQMTKCLRDGWQPFGNLVVIQGDEGFEFYQPLVELREWPT
jgi:hypothetical protein